ncbi:MAG: DUF819 family protein [Terrisporobacter othiniensis]|uniref:DUF819 family protein n=1 Tax=Terrisporobacter petrolearius TaxID=1460447 RepID=UPI002909AF54|nr:DUF819 family protein [Terrisporobacter othiniensis]MDU6995169.1 DUF819 family protein [Terrisporobacter othiniensis]
MKTLISSENIWVLWAFITGWAAFSIYLEQKYEWASKVSGAIIALIGALILSNLKVIPTESVVYDQVWTYVVPLAITLLLYQCNITKIWKESGKILVLFLISSIGTMLGSILGFLLLNKHIPELGQLAGMMTGSYIGGGANFAAMASAFDIPGDLVSAAVVSDNLLMALYFFVLISIPSIAFFRKKFKHPHIDEVEKVGIKEGETAASSYWKSKEVSLKDIGFCIGSAFIIVALSVSLADFLASVIPTSNAFLKIINTLFGNQYLIITTVTMLCATIKSDFFGNLGGAQEIGTFLIYLFFVVIGVPASISSIINNSPLLLVFCLIIVLVNMLVTFGAAKLFKFNLEDAILASNACIGGPTTAAAMAVSKSWSKLIAPIMLIGTLGYVIGNYCGIIVGNFLI